MKRHGSLFSELTAFSNLLSAHKKARKGAVGKQETQKFTFFLEYELFRLQEELIQGSYQPRPYRYFRIHDPKDRTISVAAFRDRVVHHALINVLEPIYERCFIHDSYATRKGKGTHKAIDRAQHFLRQTGWFWKTDVDQYFDSIVHTRLLALLEKKIKDPRLLAIAGRIIRNGGRQGVGLPIGNLTSQFFANVYLNKFDHFAKEQLGAKYYIRYMDDFVFFHSDKKVLKNNRERIHKFLMEELDLQLKVKATYLNNAKNGLTFLGRRIFPAVIRIARPNKKRILRRMAQRQKDYQLGRIKETQFLQSMNSYWAQLEPYSGLRHKILKG